LGRIARIVIPNCPHHIIQRGNRRQPVFFCDSDRYLYLRILREQGIKAGIIFLAYCLMNNHVHLIAIPRFMESFARGIAEAHRKYTTIINIRKGWKGYLWQGRFISYPLDDRHLYSAVRYAENNPVRANLVENAEDYPWSSAPAHVYHTQNRLLTNIDEFLDINNWSSYLKEKEEASVIENLKKHERTGRPLGDEEFIKKLEDLSGRRLRPRVYTKKRGTEYCVPLFK